LCCLQEVAVQRNRVEVDGMVSIAQVDEFKVGQVWAGIGRIQDPAPRLVIGRLERIEDLGVVAHVHIMGVKVYSPMAPTGFSDSVGHVPFALDALRRSVKDVVGEAAVGGLSDFEAGYQEWKSAQDGGVWDVPVSEVLSTIESVLQKQ
jgi:hypothetical protein